MSVTEKLVRYLGLTDMTLTLVFQTSSSALQLLTVSSIAKKNEDQFTLDKDRN